MVPVPKVGFISGMTTKIISINSKTYGLFEILLDDDDYIKLKDLKWHIQKIYHMKSRDVFYVRRYINRDGKQSSIGIHNEICPQWKKIDHINGNPLDNRKENLRDGTLHNSKNYTMRIDNTSGYKGVSFKNKCGKWQALIQLGSKRKYLGLFDDPVKAAKAYNKAALLYYGKYAKLNNIEE